jgi:hypothetical protein
MLQEGTTEDGLGDQRRSKVTRRRSKAIKGDQRRREGDQRGNQIQSRLQSMMGACSYGLCKRLSLTGLLI